MISSSIRKRIVEETNIVEVVSEYVKLEKKGSSFFGICPFHEDNHPSMSVSEKVKCYNCFSCGAKGNVISFVSRIENISKDQATIKLANRLGIKINQTVSKEALKKERLEKIMNDAANFYAFYLKNSEEGEKALKYLHDRGISDEVIDKFQIGLAPSLNDALAQFLLKKSYMELDLVELGLIKNNEKNEAYDIFRTRVMFPLCNEQGAVIGFSGRIYTNSNQAKYINSNDTFLFHKGEVLYNLNKAALPARKKDKIYLFEGFMDVIAADRANVDNGVATMGTALTTNHVNKLLQITKNIVLCFDGDEAGIHAMKRSALILASYNIIPEAVVLPDGMDPDEYIKAYGNEALSKYLVDKAKPVYHYLYTLAKKDVLKSDVVSVEKFKQTVFEFITYSKQSTIIEFYLKELATDLGVSVDVIKADYEQKKGYYIREADKMLPRNDQNQNANQNPVNNNSGYDNGYNVVDYGYDYPPFDPYGAYQIPNNAFNDVPNNNKPVETNPTNKVSSTPLAKKYMIAYQTILKYCFYDLNGLSKVIEKDIQSIYVNNDELINYASMMRKIIELYSDGIITDSMDEPHKIIYEEYQKNEIYKKEIDKILSNPCLLMGDKEKEFDDCLKTLELLPKNEALIRYRYKALNGTAEEQSAFLKKIIAIKKKD